MVNRYDVSSYGINSLLVLQLLRHSIRRLQVLQITSYEMHSADISILLQPLHGFLCMLLFLRDQDDFRGVVLEEVGCDPEADAGSSSGDDIHLGFGT